MSVPAAPSKRSTPRAEAGTVEKATKAPVRKRATAPGRATPAPPSTTRSWVAIALVALLGLAAAGAIALSLVRDDEIASVPAAAVSQDELVLLARSRDTPVYWAGRIAGRELELTTTADGTVVRYLPAGVEAGADRRTLTVATYPVRDAFATVNARAKGEGMRSGETRNGGVAVWSRAQPTSVYVAFPGVAQLVEIYAPDAAEARRLALSGRIRPVR